jgi:hypothetical protein
MRFRCIPQWVRSMAHDMAFPQTPLLSTRFDLTLGVRALLKTDLIQR